MNRLHARRWWALSSAVVLIGVVLALPAELSAQAVRGTLLGTITDQAGLALPGAAVTATEVNTNIGATTVTNESGFYTFTLRDGVYRVEAELSGFKKTVRQGIEVDVNTTVRVDLRLEVGVVEESITVTAQTPLLQTDRADTGRIIEGMLIQSVPLGFNRNFQGMLVTVPGATRPFRPHSEFFNAQDSLSTNVNGQSRLANNVQLEGVDDNHKTGLLTVLVPSAEAIETVSISTGNYDAEFGRAGGAITNVTLKSGTNAFKGSLFMFGNTEATMASGYFSHLTSGDEVPAIGLHARRAAQERPAVFLRRLSAHPRSTWPHHARDHSDHGVPERRFQRRADDHLRSADRQCRRHRPDAVSGQHHSRQSHQSDCAIDSLESARAQSCGSARPDQLPGAVRARQDHQVVRREDQPADHAARIRSRAASASRSPRSSTRRFSGCSAAAARTSPAPAPM